jgi:hypothetical protein
VWCQGELRQFCANFQRAYTEAEERAGRIPGSEFKLVVLYDAAAAGDGDLDAAAEEARRRMSGWGLLREQERGPQQQRQQKQNQKQKEQEAAGSATFIPVHFDARRRAEVDALEAAGAAWPAKDAAQAAAASIQGPGYAALLAAVRASSAEQLAVERGPADDRAGYAALYEKHWRGDTGALASFCLSPFGSVYRIPIGCGNDSAK